MREPTIARIALTSLLTILAAGCAAEAIDDDPEGVVEQDFELAWEDDPDLEGSPPACPPDDPACDRLDDADTAEAELLETLEAAIGDAAAPADAGTGVFALADPRTASGRYRIWPHGRIPYAFARTSSGAYQLNASTRATVSAAMTSWSTLTEGRIKFVKRTSADAAYVSIRLGASRVRPFVGYRSGKVQELYVRQGEFLTVSKHELGHVIGFHHEQRRSDRASHIRVRTANIANSDACRFQFSVCSTCKKVGAYDRVSVMHYRTKDLANCRTGPVLLDLDGSSIGHVWKVSKKDRSAVAAMYAANAALATAPTGPDSDPDALLVPESGSVTTDSRCLDVSRGSTAEGAEVATGSCGGAASQDWRATRAGQLRASHSLRCSAVTGDSVPGAPVEQAVCAVDDPAQRWTFDGMELVHGATGDCLGAAGGAIAAAACTGAGDQRFDYRPEAEAIVSGGLCVTAPDAVGAAVGLRACDGGPGQRWLQARGGFVSRASLGHCLGLADGRLALAECTDDLDQRWALRGAIRDGRAGLCLDGGGAADAPLALAACAAAPAQTWTFWSR